MKRWKQLSRTQQYSAIATAFFIGIPTVVSLSWTLATRDATAGLPPPAPWVEAARGDDGGVFYLDPTTVSSRGDVRNAAVLRVYPEVSVTGGGSYLFRVDYNCNTQEAQFRSGVEFVGRHGVGALTGDRIDARGPVVQTGPGEVLFYIGASMCR